MKIVYDCINPSSSSTAASMNTAFATVDEAGTVSDRRPLLIGVIITTGLSLSLSLSLSHSVSVSLCLFVCFSLLSLSLSLKIPLWCFELNLPDANRLARDRKRGDLFIVYELVCYRLHIKEEQEEVLNNCNRTTKSPCVVCSSLSVFLSLSVSLFMGSFLK